MNDPRPVAIGDRPGVLRLLRDAFEGPLEAALVERLWEAKAIVAERLIEDEGVVAYAAVSAVSIGHFGSKEIIGEALGLAPVASASRRQNEGLGAAVVNAAIDTAFKAFPNRLMFVLGDPAYYRRFGFIPASPFGYLWEGGDMGDAFQFLSKHGLVSPYVCPAEESGVTLRAVVFYHDAFSVFNVEN